MTRRHTAILIVGIWIASLGWLAARERSVGAARRRAAVVYRVGPEAATYALKMGEQQVGLMLRKVDTLPGEIYISERWDLTLPANATTAARRMLLLHESWLTRDLRLVRFHSERRGDAAQLDVTGRIVRDTSLAWSALRDGVRYADTLSGHAPEGWSVTSSLPLTAMYSDAGHVGGTVAVDLFDPLTFRHAPVNVKATNTMAFTLPDSAVNDTVSGLWSAAHIDSVTAIGLGWSDSTRESIVWTDPSGMPVRLAGPFGIVAERSAFELVRQGYHPTNSPTTGTAR